MNEGNSMSSKHNDKDTFFRVKGTGILLIKSYIHKSYRDARYDQLVMFPEQYLEQVFLPAHESMWTDNATRSNMIYNAREQRFEGLDSTVDVSEFLSNPKRFRRRSEKDDFHQQLEGILRDNHGEPVTFIYEDGRITVEMYPGSDEEIRYATDSPGQGLEEVATDLFEREEFETRLQRNPVQ